MNRYIAGRLRANRRVIYGLIEAEDIVCATLKARHRWPNCGVFPWRAATKVERELALSKAQRGKERAA